MEAQRKSKQSMTIPEKFDLMALVKFEYPKLGQTDTEFSKTASSKLGFEVAAATIKHYREGFGIEQIKQAPVSELKARIAELEARLEAELQSRAHDTIARANIALAPVQEAA